ncbi:pentatricopeptide repeat-containing protein, putative [Ricinus communis]|uniref:Pentatricopeptide repeat-containing protein, putative n=1 Tax=Ricinus communis TaxID=3988 RepID=B9T0V0_RICCO|nr:pentatricopeptide repeat-containing protein, putative [Ricinus communis]
MPERDVVSWTVLIMGYRNAENYGDALIAFEQMQYAGIVPNHVTMVNVLGACARFGAIEMGIWIHDFIRRSGWEIDVILGTSLIDMYAKCGKINESLSVFRSMKEKNIFAWNAVIKGLAFAKCGQEAVRWFFTMEQEGFKPDEVTFVNVLSTCSHSGFVDLGKQLFGKTTLQKEYARSSIPCNSFTIFLAFGCTRTTSSSGFKSWNQDLLVISVLNRCNPNKAYLMTLSRCKLFRMRKEPGQV